jgi:hypothetical protein
MKKKEEFVNRDLILEIPTNTSQTNKQFEKSTTTRDDENIFY